MYHCCEMFKNICYKYLSACAGRQDQENFVLDIDKIVVYSTAKASDNMLETTKQHLGK